MVVAAVVVVVVVVVVGEVVGESLLEMRGKRPRLRM